MSSRWASLPPQSRQALATWSVVSGKWKAVVLLAIAHKEPAGFNELQSELSSISGKVLSEMLSELAEEDLIERLEVSQSPLRVEYTLTAAGADLADAIHGLADWADGYLEDEGQTVLIAAPDRRLTEMYERWIDDRYRTHRAHNRSELEAALEGSVDVLLFEGPLPGVTLDMAVPDVDSITRFVLLAGDRPDLHLKEESIIDGVITTPTVRDELRESIERQLELQGEPPAERNKRSAECRTRVLERTHSDVLGDAANY